MTQWEKVKKYYKTKYNLDLEEEDKPDYERIAKQMNKKLIPQTIFILFGAVALLYIVFGILSEQLAMDEYTLAPFIVITIIVLANASGLSRITTKYERELIETINRKRNITQPIQQTPQPPVQQYTQQPMQQRTQQPVRQHQIPPELLKIMQDPQAPKSGTLTFSTMSSTMSEHTVMGSPNPSAPVPAKKPTLAATCPACGQLIPSESNPCPKCGAQLYWD